MNKVYKNFSYEVDRNKNVLAWKVTGQLELSEIFDIVSTIQGEVKKLPAGQIKLLVDNRGMVDENGKDIVFNNQVNEEWIKLQGWLLGYCSHVAVLCGTLMMKAQMNRLATTSGLEKVLKAFWNANDPGQTKAVSEAYAFLGIDSNKLVG